MKSFGAISVAWAAVAMARPQPLPHDVRGEPHRVQVLATNVTGADKTAFPPVPSQLDASQRAFLEKYQPLSDAALAKVAPVTQSSFSAAGFCFSEFPCLSVTQAAVATIGDKEEIEREQVAAILDRLTSSPEATFGAVPDTPFSGLKITEQGAVLDVIGVPGTMESKALAGMVFDMFKLQSDDVSTNAIRATQAQTDGGKQRLIALCVYPEGVDALQAFHFCMGNELNGEPLHGSAPSTIARSIAKREFNIGPIVSIVCSIFGC